MSTKVCHGLKQMGAKKGDVLAMFLPNCMEYPVVFGAATNAGKVFLHSIRFDVILQFIFKAVTFL